MGIILEVEESGFVGFIEDGEVLNARVITVDLKTKPFNDDVTGEPVKKFEFKFKIDDPSGAFDGQMIWGEVNSKLSDHPGNRLHNWAESILGQRLPGRYKLNTDDLQDKNCRIIVGKTTKQGPQGEKTRNFVREVHPTKENAARLAADDTDEPF